MSNRRIIPPKFPLAYPFLMREKVRVLNYSGDVIPHGACMATSAPAMFRNRLSFRVNYPDTALGIQPWLVNCGHAIEAASGAWGWGTRLCTDGFVIISGSDDPPTAGESWGPENHSWVLRKGYPGFTITGSTRTIGGHLCCMAIASPQHIYVGESSGNVSPSTAGAGKVFSHNLLANTGWRFTSLANIGSGTINAGDSILMIVPDLNSAGLGVMVKVN